MLYWEWKLMRKLLIVTVLFLPAAWLRADKKTNNTAPIPVVSITHKELVRFEKDVEPILVNKCMFCHSGPVKEAKLDMSSYDALMKGGKSGKPIVPGKSSDSMLIKL